MKFKIIYDNEANSRFQSGWGFSCLVGGDLLFDVGADMSSLLHNLHQASVHLEDIHSIVLSHEHNDHVGGIDIINMLEDLDVYIPKSFSRRLRKRLRSKENVRVEEVDGAKEIADGIYTTGELGRSIKEQSLVVESKQGKIVLTGCSHPGLENILETASRFGEIYGVIGGFHGFSKLEALYDLNLIIPCHCTARKNEIFEMYPDKSRKCSAGFTIDI